MDLDIAFREGGNDNVSDSDLNDKIRIFCIFHDNNLHKTLSYYLNFTCKICCRFLNGSGTTITLLTISVAIS